jgi:SAM-dependent methyltransferase
MTPKTAFRNTLQLRDTSRTVFVPFAYSLAARVAQLPLKEMGWNPTYYAHSLESCYNLFRHDAVVNCFDSSVEAESFGCEVIWEANFEMPKLVQGSELQNLAPEDFIRSGRIPILLEATNRLVISLGRETGIVAAMTGPCSFVRTLQQYFEQFTNKSIQESLTVAGKLLTKFVRCLCELRIDAIFFREDTLGKDFWNDLQPFKKSYSSVYRTLFNIVRFYNSFCVIILKDIEAEFIEELCRFLRPNGLIVIGKRFNEAELMYLKQLSESLGVSFGLPIPIGLENENELWEQVDVMESFLMKFHPRGFFYTSDGEIPHDLPLETLYNLIKRIRT